MALLSAANMSGVAASRPTASIAGRLYFATDTFVLSYDTGSVWTTIPTSGLSSSLLLDYVLASDISALSVPSPATTWTDFIANQSFTVTNAVALIDVIARGLAFFNSGAEVGVRIVIDSAGTPIIKTLGGAYGTLQNIFAGAGAVNVGALSAAAHTVKVQMTATTTAAVYCRPVTAAPESFALQVMQRP